MVEKGMKKSQWLVYCVATQQTRFSPFEGVTVRVCDSASGCMGSLPTGGGAGHTGPVCSSNLSKLVTA